MAAHHQDHTRLTFELPVIDHKKLKALAALSGISLKDLILTCLRENLLSENEPNEETIKVFQDTDQRKKLVRYKNADDLIDKLGLK
jgi:antitoxin component of RelBE/YafQ-DinJ toxin-antitoxin module